MNISNKLKISELTRKIKKTKMFNETINFNKKIIFSKTDSIVNNPKPDLSKLKLNQTINKNLLISYLKSSTFIL